MSTHIVNCELLYEYRLQSPCRCCRFFFFWNPLLPKIAGHVESGLLGRGRRPVVGLSRPPLGLLHSLLSCNSSTRSLARWPPVAMPSRLLFRPLLVETMPRVLHPTHGHSPTDQKISSYILIEMRTTSCSLHLYPQTINATQKTSANVVHARSKSTLSPYGGAKSQAERQAATQSVAPQSVAPHSTALGLLAVGHTGIQTG